ncbi:CFEM domain-containing protein [Colletotrichum incanum]|nr:CFEM domain-containing protein [Colletotrichum incanum]
MKNIIGLVVGIALLLSGAAAAENCASVAVTAIPSCAQSCFLEGASFVGCDSLDFSCQCGKEAALYAAIEPCVATGCPAASIQAVINGASSVVLAQVKLPAKLCLDPLSPLSQVLQSDLRQQQLLQRRQEVLEDFPMHRLRKGVMAVMDGTLSPLPLRSRLRRPSMLPAASLILSSYSSL